MPLLKIESNRDPDAEARRALLSEASRRVAELLGKPERYVMVSFAHRPDMLFAGSDEAMAYLELKSIGLPESRTPELSRGLTELIQAHLDVAPDRVYIEFADAPRALWGWNGGTF